MTHVHRPSWLRGLLLAVSVLAALLAGLVGLLLYLLVAMPGESVPFAAQPGAEEQARAERLRAHVRVLADEIGERHAGIPGSLDRAADHLRAELEALGYQPQAEPFGDEGFRNLRVDIPGRFRADEIVVLGAHYDSAPGTPGADDNASGVAVLLELARELQGRQFNRTVRLVAFVNEELPFSGGELMGSRMEALRSRAEGERVLGMLSLEMLGYYSSEPGSQIYPPIVRSFYPSAGDFLAFVSNASSRGFLHQALGAFRRARAFPSEGMAAPLWLVEDIRRSDHASYWEAGYPALMVTDTSNFRNPHYHGAGDLPDTLDYQAMARIVSGLVEMTAELAGGAAARLAGNAAAPAAGSGAGGN